MGSRSYGNWSVAEGVGTLRGVVTVLERPAASWVRASPGFIKAGATGRFPDASAAVPRGSEGTAHVVLEVRVHRGQPFADAQGAHLDALQIL